MDTDILGYHIFQSTLPRGERQNPCCIILARCNFNPRSHGGSDIFFDAPTLTSKNFNPRSHGGSDIFRSGRYSGITDFNPRSHGGSDTFSIYPYVRVVKFQSTLPRGERQQKSPNLNSNFCKVVTKIHCFLLFEKLISI